MIYRRLAELTTAPCDQAAAILCQYKDWVDALPADKHEQILADVQDILSENSKETD
jgi:hypothetical protein